MLKRSLFALALATALPMSAQAGEVSYSYIQAGYAATNVGGGDFDGWSVDGSIGFGESNFYGFGGYTTGDESSTDFNQTHLGLGWHSTGNAQWFGELSWIKNDVDFGGGFGVDDNGYNVSGGVRGFLGDKFEGKVKIGYTDVGNFGDGFSAGVSGILHFNDTWGAYASYDYSDRSNTYFGDTSVDTWGLGVRASF